MPSPTPPTARCRVLIVEDEFFLANDLQTAVASLEADVMALVGDLGDARAQIARGGFDVCTLDIELHGDKTFSLADELQRQEIPFVFTTGYGPQIIPMRFADVTRWEKPFDPYVVARCVLRLWHGRSDAKPEHLSS
jgi:DNA-binding NtrC family response regulator